MCVLMVVVVMVMVTNMVIVVNDFNDQWLLIAGRKIRLSLNGGARVVR